MCTALSARIAVLEQRRMAAWHGTMSSNYRTMPMQRKSLPGKNVTSTQRPRLESRSLLCTHRYYNPMQAIAPERPSCFVVVALRMGLRGPSLFGKSCTGAQIYYEMQSCVTTKSRRASEVHTVTVSGRDLQGIKISR